MARRVWRSLGRLVQGNNKRIGGAESAAVEGLAREDAAGVYSQGVINDLLTCWVLEHESGPCVLCEVELGAEFGWVECFGN
jgi:hypothetical protein